MLRKRFQTNIPFSVHSWPDYYGWVIRFFGTVGMIAAVPGSPPGMSVFVDGMIESMLPVGKVASIGIRFVRG